MNAGQNKKRKRSPAPDNVRISRHGVQPRNVSDRIILAHADQILPGSALLVMLSGTAVARHLLIARPEVHWKIHTFEHFYLSSVVNGISDEELIPQSTEIELFCTPDLPDGLVDTVVMATDSRGSAELLRDVLQDVAARLKPKGRLIISTNNPKDHWLHEHLKKHFGRVTVFKLDDGICYVARKKAGTSKQKVYHCEFAFRDGEKLISCISRPGVFSHRRIDGGARALIRSLEQVPDAGGGDMKIVEMGCGSGAVSTAAALRYPQAEVLAVDSHARAVQSTEETAAANGVTNLTVRLTSDGSLPEAGDYDLFLCNPPYYSDYRISELFLQSAAESLNRGGRIHLVTKLTDWHCNRMIEIFANAEIYPYGEYNVIYAEV